MAPKGLSLDEKRKRMLDIFYDSKDVFLLKDLEKIAPKQKGITMQSVKDVVQSLVDDNLVDSDKIGTSVYFWAFPSKALAQRQSQLSQLREKLDASRSKSTELNKVLENASSGREDSEDRKAILEEVAEVEAQKELIKSKIKKFEGCDPEVLEKIEGDAKMAKEAINRWTDNIFAVQSWIGKKFPSVNQEDMSKQFEIPQDLDYYE